MAWKARPPRGKSAPTREKLPASLGQSHRTAYAMSQNCANATQLSVSVAQSTVASARPPFRRSFRLTGKNGSGKTSVLDEAVKLTSYIPYINNRLDREANGLMIDFNCTSSRVAEAINHEGFVIASFKDMRRFDPLVPTHVEKVVLHSNPEKGKTPGDDFVKYLLDLKMTQALALTRGDTQKASGIESWFKGLEGLLKTVFDDPSTRLVFDEDTFKFSLVIDGRDPFDFNTLSSGYSAVFDIILDLIMRMEAVSPRRLDFLTQGVVFIDEIESHMHLKLQREILPFLTRTFPNVQFIVSSHSPFVLNSVDNVVIYDLERRMLISESLTDVPYDGVVEGYFESDLQSAAMRTRFERYKQLVGKAELSDDDLLEVAELEVYLDEVPDYLALDFAAEYARLKLEFENREA